MRKTTIAKMNLLKARKKGPRAAREPDEELGKKIRLRRVEQKMSQADLGAILGVSFQQVQKYEKGLNRVSVGRLHQIAAALEVPTAFFYDRQSKDDVEVQSLLYQDSSFSLRLLRAYIAIKDVTVRRQFVSLMERVAGNEVEEEE